MSFAARDLISDDDLTRLRQRSTWRGLFCVGHAWTMILGTIAVMLALPLIWRAALTPLAIAIIGSRQLGLAILMHEGAHGGLARSPALNMFVSQWFCGYPIGVDTKLYRGYHFRHHAHTQTRQDPDLILSAPFPVTPQSLRRKFLRDLTGQTGLKQRIAQFRAAIGAPAWPSARRAHHFWQKLGPSLVVNAGLLAGAAAAGHVYAYALFWVVPLLTWQQAVTRMRNIAEHAVLPVAGDPMAAARTTKAGFLERVFVAPYWVNYHAEHHLLFYIPCYHLPAFHAAMIAGPHGTRLEVRDSYRTVLRLATDPAARAQQSKAAYAGLVPLGE